MAITLSICVRDPRSCAPRSYQTCMRVFALHQTTKALLDLSTLGSMAASVPRRFGMSSKHPSDRGVALADRNAASSSAGSGLGSAWDARTERDSISLSSKGLCARVFSGESCAEVFSSLTKLTSNSDRFLRPCSAIDNSSCIPSLAFFNRSLNLPGV